MTALFHTVPYHRAPLSEGVLYPGVPLNDCVLYKCVLYTYYTEQSGPPLNEGVFYNGFPRTDVTHGSSTFGAGPGGVRGRPEWSDAFKYLRTCLKHLAHLEKPAHFLKYLKTLPETP